jgi:hypothetical protein
MEAHMSLFSRLTGKHASESAELKKIRVEAERRRAAKSSGTRPAITGDEAIENAVNTLSRRISEEKPGNSNG